jgi:hypothetical protein
LISVIICEIDDLIMALGESSDIRYASITGMRISEMTGLLRSQTVPVVSLSQLFRHVHFSIFDAFSLFYFKTFSITFCFPTFGIFRRVRRIASCAIRCVLSVCLSVRPSVRSV